MSNQLALLGRHELRLIWRGSLFGGKHGWVLLLGFAALMHAAGYGVTIGLARVHLPPAEQFLGAMLAMLFVGGLMLSQSVQRASELLDDRTDLGWLLSTPVSPAYILSVRLLAVAGAVSLYWLLLILPLVNTMTLTGRGDLLGVYPMMFVMALLVTSFGFAVTFVLLRFTGVKRTRALANALATLIGAAVFLGGQSRSVLSPAASDAFWRSFTPTPEAAANGLAWLPARGLLGQPGAVLWLLSLAVIAAATTSVTMQRWFAAGAQAVVAGPPADAARAGKARLFRKGGNRGLLAKEILLLRRYPGLIGLAAYYLIYLIPGVTAIWHNTGNGDGRLLAAAPVLSAGELARLFISVTVMGDEGAELVQTAPVQRRAVAMTKLAAATLGVLCILGLPVAALAFSMPATIPAMLTGLAGNIGCNLLLGLWRPAPIRRTDLRKSRKGWGGAVNLVGFFFSGAWSIATWKILQGSTFAFFPIAFAGVALWLSYPKEKNVLF